MLESGPVPFSSPTEYNWEEHCPVRGTTAAPTFRTLALWREETGLGSRGIKKMNVGGAVVRRTGIGLQCS